jgi:hypothetical protein
MEEAKPAKPANEVTIKSRCRDSSTAVITAKIVETVGA